MASAVLVNRKDADWPPQHRGGVAGAGFMGKVPFPNSNSNPNPKGPKRSQFQQFHAPSSGGGNFNGFQNDESPAVTQTASDDASSINHRRSGEFSVGNIQYVSFPIRSFSKKELSELKSRLVSELDQVQQLRSRIEAGDAVLNSQPKKAIPSKKLPGSKRSFPVNSNQVKDSSILKRPHWENPSLMKNCSQIMTKLMRHKHAWIFNKPVDVVGMGLHDYFGIIKRPMDLGTVKVNLSKNLYSSPADFAADVRLTFQNAMTYNPKGHDVHTMAEQLLVRFEDLFHPMEQKLLAEQSFDALGSSWEHKEPERPKKRHDKKPELVSRPLPDLVPAPAPIPAPVPAPVCSANPMPNSPPLVQSPVRTPSPPTWPLQAKPVKQPKPKAKDPNKREMSIEEKHRLGVGLQSLPQEKMEQVVQIIKKRNGHLKQDGDEIELDIEAVDTETLWELDRLVTNYKKMVSKIKRQALMTNLNPNNVAHSRSNGKEMPSSEKMEMMAAVAEQKRAAKKGEADEDVDIGDDLPMSSFPPVEIEKDEREANHGNAAGGGHASSSASSGGSSSSSSGGSSSSSDSGSGSSSGSDSDDDNAHS